MRQGDSGVAKTWIQCEVPQRLSASVCTMPKNPAICLLGLPNLKPQETPNWAMALECRMLAMPRKKLLNAAVYGSVCVRKMCENLVCLSQNFHRKLNLELSSGKHTDSMQLAWICWIWCRGFQNKSHFHKNQQMVDYRIHKIYKTTALTEKSIWHDHVCDSHYRPNFQLMSHSASGLGFNTRATSHLTSANSALLITTLRPQSFARVVIGGRSMAYILRSTSNLLDGCWVSVLW